MDIELLVVPDCPHQSAGGALLRTAIADVGLPAGFRVLTITDADDAALHGFAGSRTFRADGLDLFPERSNDPIDLSHLRSGSRTGGLPDLHVVREALKRGADQARIATVS